MEELSQAITDKTKLLVGQDIVPLSFWTNNSIDLEQSVSQVL